jgi:hypothetical protein
MSTPDQELLAFMASAETRLQTQEQSLNDLVTAVDGLRQIEPVLRVFIDNIDFFKAIISGLEPRLSTMEGVLEGLDFNDATNTLHGSLQDGLQAFRLELNAFRIDVNTQIATARANRTTTIPAAPKGKMALPAPFSGKRDDWKVFSDHLTLYLTANNTAYPSDSDKIVFAVSRLGEGSAFKYMMQFIPKLTDPVALRPAIITSFEQFLSTMKDTFGVQNANIVAESQLLQLQQKGSAVDYVNKFQELSSDLGWNDSALIAHFRRGLKIEVVKAIDMLETTPTTFPAFVQKAIDLDTKQYATFLELKNRSPFTSATRTTTTKTLPTFPRPAAARPPPTPAIPAEPSMAMDLSQVRHLSPEEKKRRQDQGLCLYCGQGDHFAKLCPNKKTLASADVAYTSDHVRFSLENEEA